ncbi:MAG: N-acetyltransferase [Chloroflexi bacterium]|nr:MAG: N-acetyltransferase [Chloroflexota bacterium]
MIKIETARLLLRQPLASDEERIQKIVNHPAIGAQTFIPYPNENFARRWLARASHAKLFKTGFYFVIIEKDSGDIIGTIRAAKITESDDLFELGYWLGVDYWGRGYASEAALALVDYCVNVAGVQRLCATCFADNLASIRVLEKCGLERLAAFTRVIRHQGRSRQLDYFFMEANKETKN